MKKMLIRIAAGCGIGYVGAVTFFAVEIHALLKTMEKLRSDFNAREFANCVTMLPFCEQVEIYSGLIICLVRNKCNPEKTAFYMIDKISQEEES